MLSWNQLLVVLILGTTAFFWFRRKSRDLPGPMGVPILGSIPFLTNRPYLKLKEWGKQYGPIFRTKFGLKNVIVIDDVNILRDAFADPVFSGRPENKVFSFISNGKHGISSADGKEWNEQRRFAQRTLREFGFGTGSMEKLVMDEVKDFLIWMKRNEGLPMSMSTRLVLATVNSLWTMLAGIRHEQDDPEILQITETSTSVFRDISKANSIFLLFPTLMDVVPSIFLRSWNETLAKFNPFLKLFSDAVLMHRMNRTDEPKDFIDRYLIEIEKTTDPQSTFYKETGYRTLLIAVGDLYGAAQGTTSGVLVWSVLYLIRFPKCQAKLQDELDRVVGRNRQPQLADRPSVIAAALRNILPKNFPSEILQPCIIWFCSLPYTQALMSEILRYSSVGPLGLFHETMEDTEFRGYDIKKGTTVIGNLYSIHYNETIWGDPEYFRPERFLSPDEKFFVKNDNLVGFGTGKRQCPGEVMGRDSFFLFLTNIFQNFQIFPDPSNPEPSLIAAPTFFREPEHFNVVFKERINF